MKKQNYKDRLAEAEGKKKSMRKKTQSTKDRLDEAEPKKRKTHRMKDGTLHTGATHTKNSKVIKEPKKMKKQTTKDRLAEAEGKKKSMVKKTQSTKDRLDEAEPKKRVSWMFGGKRYYGTLIPSREDKDNRYARTENGKIKVLPKKKVSKK